MAEPEWACTIVVHVLARDVGKAREKLAQQVRVSYRLVGIEASTDPPPGWQAAEGCGADQ